MSEAEVEALMAEVKRRMEEKRRKEAEGGALLEAADVWGPLDKLVSRRRIIGPVVTLKRLRRIIGALIMRQVEFNRMVARELLKASKDIDSIRQAAAESEKQSIEAVKRVEERISRVERKVDEVSGEIRKVLKVLEEVSARLTVVEEWRKAISEAALRGEGGLEELRRLLEGSTQGGSHFELGWRFRGDPEHVKRHQSRYLRYFEGRSNVVDVGCGRGEFLELLAERGVECYGIEADLDMYLYCRSKGLKVVYGDALEHLRKLSDGSLGGVFLSHVAEHLEPGRLLELIRLCYRKLRSGCYLVVESPNPASLYAMAKHFYRDYTHVKPIHPDAMAFLLEKAGFQDVEVQYVSDVPEDERLKLLDSSGLPREAAETLNENFMKLNSVIFASQDYAVVGRKP